MLPAITCANDSSGSMALPTLVPVMVFRRPIKVSSTKLCTAKSHCMEMGPVCRSRLMPVTGEPTQMRRLAEEIGLDGAMYKILGAFHHTFGRLSCILEDLQRRFVFHGHM